MQARPSWAAIGPTVARVQYAARIIVLRITRNGPAERGVLSDNSYQTGESMSLRTTSFLAGALALTAFATSIAHAQETKKAGRRPAWFEGG